MVQDPALDRALGSFLGLAIGDAVGTSVEFLPRGSFPPLTDMIGGGPFRLNPGQWTDDTSMALCLAESLLHHAELDQLDLMRRFLRWAEEGYNSSTGYCFDIGRTTLGAIARFRRAGVPVAGSTDPRDAGNGSIMRLSPVAARWWRDPARAEQVARRQSVTTHAAPEAVDCCALLARILCAAIAGQDSARLSVSIEDGWQSAVRAVASGAWRGRSEKDISSTGYVVHTLEAALWSVERTSSFEAAILVAANLGHDSDTVAAVAGQIAGAIYGASAIPSRWLDKLWGVERIRELGHGLHRAAATDI